MPIDYETHCARIEAEWLKERTWCVCCNAEMNYLAAEDEEDSVRVIKDVGEVCVTCALKEVESQEVA